MIMSGGHIQRPPQAVDSARYSNPTLQRSSNERLSWSALVRGLSLTGSIMLHVCLDSVIGQSFQGPGSRDTMGIAGPSPPPPPGAGTTSQPAPAVGGAGGGRRALPRSATVGGRTPRSQSPCAAATTQSVSSTGRPQSPPVALRP